MTVGLACICGADTSDPKVVVAADRMVTSGRAARREYEHTSSKMVSIIGENGDSPVTAVGVGAGSVSLADEVFYKIDNKIQKQTPQNVRDIANKAVLSLQEVVQETIERQILSPYELDLNTFNQVQGQMNPQIVQGIYQEIKEKQNEVLQQVNLLLAGVDERGAEGDGGGNVERDAHLYNILHNDMARNDSIGYLTVGSGAEPANSDFIRKRYDDNCDLPSALLAITEAKTQAEEAQGVGEDVDIAILHGGGRRDLDESELKNVRDVHEDVVAAESNAREEELEENNYTFSL